MFLDFSHDALWRKLSGVNDAYIVGKLAVRLAATRFLQPGLGVYQLLRVFPSIYVCANNFLKNFMQALALLNQRLFKDCIYCVLALRSARTGQGIENVNVFAC